MAADLVADRLHRLMDGGNVRKTRAKQPRRNFARLLINVADEVQSAVCAFVVRVADHIRRFNARRHFVVGDGQAAFKRALTQSAQNDPFTHIVIRKGIIHVPRLARYRKAVKNHIAHVPENGLIGRCLNRGLLVLLLCGRVENVDDDNRAVLRQYKVRIQRFAQVVVCPVVGVADCLNRRRKVRQQNRLVHICAAARNGVNRQSADVNRRIVAFAGRCLMRLIHVEHRIVAVLIQFFHTPF